VRISFHVALGRAGKLLERLGYGLIALTVAVAVSAFGVFLAPLVFTTFIANLLRLPSAYPLESLLAGVLLRLIALVKIVFVNACQKIDTFLIDTAYKAVLRGLATLLGKQLLARKSWLRGRRFGRFGSGRSRGGRSLGGWGKSGFFGRLDSCRRSGGRSPGGRGKSGFFGRLGSCRRSGGRSPGGRGKSWLSGGFRSRRRSRATSSRRIALLEIL